MTTKTTDTKTTEAEAAAKPVKRTARSAAAKATTTAQAKAEDVKKTATAAVEKASAAEEKLAKKAENVMEDAKDLLEDAAEEVMEEVEESKNFMMRKYNEAKARVDETRKNVEEARDKATGLARDVAYAYVGTFAKGIDAVDSMVKQYKEDRDAMFKDYVASGESFVETYREKLAEKRENFSIMGKKKEAEAIEA